MPKAPAVFKPVFQAPTSTPTRRFNKSKNASVGVPSFKPIHFAEERKEDLISVMPTAAEEPEADVYDDAVEP
jgi:hypothetical protein